MTEGIRLLIWEPQLYRLELDCGLCSESINPKSPFFIHSTDIKNLLPNPNTEPYTVRCAECGLGEFMKSEFDHMFKEAIRYYKPTAEYSETPFLASVRQIVRDELKQILKEEAFDPNGPFSPAP